MNQEKNIEVLRKRNTQLQEENAKLREQVKNIQKNDDRVTIELEKIEKLKDEWHKQIEAIKEQRKKYAELMTELRKLKKVKDAFER